jgi:hypothetical protein
MSSATRIALLGLFGYREHDGADSVLHIHGCSEFGDFWGDGSGVDDCTLHFLCSGFGYSKEDGCACNGANGYGHVAANRFGDGGSLEL